MSFDYHHGRRDFFGTVGRYSLAGLMPQAPTTPSSQVAGGAGLTTVNVNEDAGLLRLPLARFLSDKGQWDVDEGGLVAHRLAQVDTALISSTGRAVPRLTTASSLSAWGA